jgi:DNA polymerase III gamma/tau subunit
VLHISRYDEKGALEQLRCLLDAGADTRTLIKDLADIFRRMMWISAGAKAEEPDTRLEPLVQSFGKGACLRALDILIRKEYEMRLNLRSDIVLETAVMALMCPEDDEQASDTQRLEKLESRLNSIEEKGIKTPAPAGPINDPVNIKEQEKKAAEKTVKIKPVKKADLPDAGGIWEKLLESLKKEAYFIYTHARKSTEAVQTGSKLEIRYGSADAIAADYMKQPATQKALLNKLEEITGESIAVSIVIEEEKKGKSDVNPDIHNMFSDIEEI